MQESLRPKEYKFTILVQTGETQGPPMVGKSNITSRFFKDSFTDDYDPTLEGRFTRSTYLDNEEFILEVTDTAGIPWSRSFRSVSLRDTPQPLDTRQGRTHFRICHRPRTHFPRGRHPPHRGQRAMQQQCNCILIQVPCILVGNKVDLEKFRQVAS